MCNNDKVGWADTHRSLGYTFFYTILLTESTDSLISILFQHSSNVKVLTMYKTIRVHISCRISYEIPLHSVTILRSRCFKSVVVALHESIGVWEGNIPCSWDAFDM